MSSVEAVVESQIVTVSQETQTIVVDPVTLETIVVESPAGSISVVSGGPQGPPGLGFTFRGEWESDTEYFINDVVTYFGFGGTGNTYVAIAHNQGFTPDSVNKWAVIAVKGAQGDPGNDGSPDTAAQVLAKIVTVDGIGSALDADLLDGHHAVDFEIAGAASAAQAAAIAASDPVGTASSAVSAHVISSDPHGDRAYAEGLFASNDAMIFKGTIDCRIDPDFPAADRGWLYKIEFAGKIGGASGVNVEAGDSIICSQDGSLAGSYAAVGESWHVIQVNIDGAVVGPVSSTNGHVAVFDGSGGKVIADGGALGTAAFTNASAYDSYGSAGAVATDLSTHEGLTTIAHGGIVADTDSRLTDSRVPIAHAASHLEDGSDPIDISSVGSDLFLAANYL